MLNIKELGDILADKNTPSEDTRTTLIVIALVEQRIILERIAELLDVIYVDRADIEMELKRIAGALEEHNKAVNGVLNGPHTAGPAPS